MMNGYIPYVDVSESKGPLLWLFFGIAYLLSNISYFGVFVMSCLWYSAILGIVFNTSKYLCCSKVESLAVSLLMVVVLFSPWQYSGEFRAEDLCQLFLVTGMLSAVRIIYKGNSHSIHFVLLGLCFSSLFLVKFNVAFMFVSVILYSFYSAVREGVKPLSVICNIVIGALLLFLPFLVYFLLQGNLDAFCQEYFLNTFLTVNNNVYSAPVIVDILQILYVPTRLATFIMILSGCLLWGVTQERHKLFPALCFVFVYLVSSLHAHHDYYHMPANIFAIFGLTFIVRYFAKIIETHPRFVLGTTAVIVFGFVVLMNVTARPFVLKDGYFLRENTLSQDHERVLSLMKGTENPLLLNVGYEKGYGMKQHTLPACKYWALQNGATSDMLDIQKQTIRQRKADFIIVRPDSADYIRMIESSGYKRVYELKYGYVFSRIKE